MAYSIFRRAAAFFKRETVLCLSLALALASAFFVPPSLAYLSYIDWDTLALLFSLMAIVRGVQKTGLFIYLGGCLLQRTGTTRQVLFVLVFLPFFWSMLITNDVSLLTFVPFGLAVLRIIGREGLAVPLLVLQTLAANLGSMLTPMGNPQNLYLYTQSGMSFGGLCGLMLPYVLASGLCLALFTALVKSDGVTEKPARTPLENPRSLWWYGAGFILCLLGLFGLLPPVAAAAAIALFLLWKDRQVLLSVDYSLLGTFLGFFIFVGNLGSIEGFKTILAALLAGNVEIAAVLVSQVTSNVPAALLLSRFTDQWQSLAVGCNLGGLGTLIASMASLISYKMLAEAYPRQRGKYLLWFTLGNLALLALLLLLSFALSALGVRM